MLLTSDSRLTEDSISLICMACESSSLSTVLARLLIWYVTLASDWVAKALASSIWVGSSTCRIGYTCKTQCCEVMRSFAQVIVVVAYHSVKIQ